MHNTKKVAKWEIKRNLKNKTFIIGMFLTPILIVGFMLLGDLFGGSDDDNQETTNVFINDQLAIFSELKQTVESANIPWDLQQTDLTEEEVSNALADTEDTAYLFLNEQNLNQGVVPAYTSEDIAPYFMDQVQVVTGPLQALQIQELGLTEDEKNTLTQGIQIKEITTEELQAQNQTTSETNPMERIVPGAFAGFIMLSIVFTGMAIFQSASQEKKDKIAEIILSSVTPADLMQGKILGYFVLGLLQAVLSISIVLPVVAWKFDLTILEYLLVPELFLYIGIAILGYLLFASIFVGVGATMADVSTAGNFQGMVMMLPFLPFIFIGPVLSDPNGLMAQIGTYIPFTSPGVLLLRLTNLEQWPWMEIGISLIILLLSVWFFMKLAGKIFKIGILMYGKNATPAEIWKWIRA
ncbi:MULTISPECIES: ABC transporter permease [Virgibacillus]|uniref:ABC transporter permease n=1 Tax=Virgibacillus kapii TaxID=1638645 RepID=A0ABQ2DDB4_9BACI|nr:MULTISPECIES: ABC transporter permease [Virgibacillus]EQB38320.1 hypothetical protein M948_06995 [Virgibacillus sp. CM-4]MYL41026.1 ABC transporter permease subunit [Virgibacillus massiliensis]GGJ53668.1 ABC transporter permease [Virgibacillus kapii]